MSSAAEAELGALYINAHEAVPIRNMLEEMGHPQPPSPIHIDNSTAVGIVNNTIKRQRSRAMEMRYFWLLDQAAEALFKFAYHPGLENLGDYPSKLHPAHHHTKVHLHMRESPTLLPQAVKPSLRRGCVDKLNADSYGTKNPLPHLSVRNRVPAPWAVAA